MSANAGISPYTLHGREDKKLRDNRERSFERCILAQHQTVRHCHSTWFAEKDVHYGHKVSLLE